MDWQNYAMVEQLTSTNVAQYRDYKIVVCTFKRKSKNLVKIKTKTLKVIYLDDVCRLLDRPNAGRKVIISQRPRRLLKRLAVKLLNYWRQKHVLRNQWLINHIPSKDLRLSELFLKVLYSPPLNIECNKIENVCHIFYNGDVCGCASGWVEPFGNLKQDNPQKILHSPRARIVKLSSLNRSFCLCNRQLCLNAKYVPQVDSTLKNMLTPEYPTEVIIATDRSCNLRCPSCRKHYYQADVYEQNVIAEMSQKLIADGWLKKPRSVTVAGQGEVFFSKNYRDLLPQIQTNEIHILSNGILFNRDNWALLADRFKTVHAEISLDAATSTTYQKLRGGDFAKVLQNLQFISDLRQAGKINQLQLNFVVQRTNYREMAEFIELGKQFHADGIYFLHLNNWDTFDAATYARQCLIIDHKYLDRDFYEYLQKPIFHDPMVDLKAFAPYLANSAKRYDKKRR